MSSHALRRRLVGGAVVLIAAAAGDTALAACDAPAATVNCTGDVSGGVSFVPAGPIQTLNVNGLTTAIQPGSGVSGIRIDASGAGGDSGGATEDGDDGHSGQGLTVHFDGSRQIAVGGAGASGIVAVSNGGNGGNGGNGAVINAGDAGNGGNGGSVTVTAAGLITITGANAAGIFAQSAGGRGGIGGDNAIGPGSPGDGGAGGQGGAVVINSTANITAAFSNTATSGIVAVSNGGGGGRGGDCGTGCFGTGGGGPTGVGGSVSVTSNGIIDIKGSVNSYGIFAQSVGGAGGAGGSNNFLGLAGWAADSQSGGNGGTVTVQVDGGAISTAGVGSSAIYAQSVGGGGGAGGGSGIGLFYGAGGSGTAGGSGEKVTVTNYATLTATGDQSAGIYAQSIGGGGGAGGTGASVFASFGGVGGAGQNGGVVEVHNHGAITVSGNASYTNVSSATASAGIFAQSVGGGGGDGGVGAGGLANFGGTGGVAGDGRAVSVENTAAIRALCGPACTGGPAIFAQSVGGGGGNGGGAFGVVSFGGDGGAGGNGGEVRVDNSGALTTTAQTSAGIFAQSVGGGGGNGAFAGGIAAIGGNGGAGGTGGRVIVNNGQDITTGGADSAGIFAQSVGGGGGNGGGALGVGAFVSFALGGRGGAGGAAENVCVNADAACAVPVRGPAADITTTGDRSSGIFAQSVGGGGGNGGFAISGSFGLYGNVSLSIGGAGGAGGQAGNVMVGSSGTIETSGLLSHGIMASSVGGGGGTGGFAISVGASTGGNLSMTFAGNGGVGSNGGIVTVDSGTSIITHNDQSSGIYAQSVGGGGGTGGFAITGSGATFGSASLAFGGDGGNGGDGRAVTVTSQGTIQTFGTQSHGIFAESVGGGGGNGGFAISASGASYGALSLSFGGAAGNGGTAGDARVDSTGDISTAGAQSHGIFAQSVGGGGGNGGFAASAALTISPGVSLGIGVGGKGGEGATSGVAHVSSTGDIVTAGAGSIGIFAQSVAGGGGNGGFSGALALGNNTSYANSIGGTGGNGNAAGTVDVTSTGNITTGSAGAPTANAIGILAQSVGGGGGNGGFSLTLAASLKGSAIGKAEAGDAGTGGTGNTVAVTSNGTISTFGDMSHGVLAQSVGGGGGNGGFAIAGALSYKGDAEMNAVGGKGGSGNTGGNVTVTTNATAGSSIPGYSVSTVGQGAVGILAQSVGGGGGNGGFAIGAAISAQGEVTANTVGGEGGTGGNSGTVTVTNTGNIQTGGANASAILAQSVGGGGGNGGFSIAGAGTIGDDAKAATQTIGGKGGVGGTGNDVTVDHTGAITTQGALSYGILAQAVGGGGGNGGFAIGGSFALKGDSTTNTIGGDGGAGNCAGAVVATVCSGTVRVTVHDGSSIVTHGAGAGAILAQSVGGGGGTGGFSGGFAVTINTGDAAVNTVGGHGGAGSDGTRVVVTSAGSLQTTGDNAVALTAQSIGGGGGSGGFTASLGFASEAKGSTNSIGGQGGAGGNGGVVEVNNSATITTSGLLSHGILAQSVGGGGGNGGFAATGVLTLQDDAASNAIGGKGGAAGDADTVTVVNSGAITILANPVGPSASTVGIIAQSIGGGGGSGGFAGNLTVSLDGQTAGNTIGGKGGAGGAGKAVDVTNSAAIDVVGNRGIGILAQSVGGGGGNGGFAIGIAGSSSSAQSMTDTVGGASDMSGGTAGGAGNVTVTNNLGGAITTFGAMAYGILAQSVGGGGGNGGFVVGGSFSLDQDATSSVGGGVGGAAGNAGDKVTVKNYDVITTQGVNSVGILAQSIGGGGGAGGFAGALSVGSGSSASAIGGKGGSAGEGKEVEVYNAGTIHTLKAQSIGILAQSVGGGGGNGGFAITAAGSIGGGDAVSSSVGGEGGSGGRAGLVHVTNATGGLIVTEGVMSTGILAQSIGGGGGNGGFSIAGSMTSGNGGVTSSVGGKGALGGDGGEVKVDNNGIIIVNAAGSVGIMAQSVGGGGGSGGFSGSLNLSGGELGNTVGGQGGNGGKGGNVTVTSSGSITTLGDNSAAVLAQSIGGGGGYGGISVAGTTGGANGGDLQIGAAGSGQVGTDGVVTVTINGPPSFAAAMAASGPVTFAAPLAATATLETTGALSIGALVQGIAGGGGFAGTAVAGAVDLGATGVVIGLGQHGGAVGNGTVVTVDNSDNIVTHGLGAAGLVTQSIGGGGGVGAFSATGGLLGTGGTNLTFGTVGSGLVGGGDGNTVTTRSLAGTIWTENEGAIGLLAQSIGGGGGFAFVYGTPAMGSIVFGSAAGAGGNGNTTTVENSSVIVTAGTFAHGLVAQSIGGGGGVAVVLSGTGVPAALPVTAGAGGAGGNGAAVTVTNNAAIGTTGFGAHGIVAQSIGGGGGLVGGGSFATTPGSGSFAGSVGGAGTAGTVRVTNNADVITTGLDSTAIFAQSIRAGGLGQDITIEHTAGTLAGGGGNGHAVWFSGGAANLLTNAGIVTTVLGIDGMTLKGEAGGERIVNTGLTIGSVDLAGGANAFENKAAGIFNAGTTVYLGAGNTLTNEGLFSPGAYLRVLTTNITGNEVQTASGIYGLDLSFLDHTADRTNLTGSADLSGVVDLNIMRPGLAKPGTREVTIVSAALGTGTTRDTLGLDAVPTAVAQYGLVYPDLNTILLSYTIDFSPGGLTVNQHSVGNAVNAIQTAGVSPGFEPIAAALFYQPTVAGLGKVYDSLSGEGTSGVQQATFTADDRFIGAVWNQIDLWRSTTSPGGGVLAAYDLPAHNAYASTGATDFPRALAPSTWTPVWRSWATGSAHTASVDAQNPPGAGRLSYDGVSAAAGIDRQLSPDAIVGIAIGTSEQRFQVPDRATSGSVTGLQIGAYQASRWGAYYTNAMLAGGFYNNKTTRTALVPGTNEPIVPVPTILEMLGGDFSSQSISGRFEVGRKFRYDVFDVSPFVALQLTA